MSDVEIVDADGDTIAMSSMGSAIIIEITQEKHDGYGACAVRLDEAGAMKLMHYLNGWFNDRFAER